MGYVITDVILRSSSRARRCIASTKGTAGWYHLLALLRSEYSIVTLISAHARTTFRKVDCPRFVRRAAVNSPATQAGRSPLG